MNEGCALCVEVDLQRIERRIETAYLDERAGSLDDALQRLDAARDEGRALSIGLLGNAAEVLPELVRRGAQIDVVTDQTSAHDPLNGYVPAGLTVEQAEVLRAATPTTTCAASARARSPTSARSATCRRRAPRRSTTATRCAGSRRSTATTTRSPTPASSPPTSGRCSARARARSAGSALSGDPADIAVTDDAILDLFGDQDHIRRWIELARERVKFQGLPARICWLGYGERHLAGLRFNELVASRRRAGRRSSSGATTSTPARSPRPSARPRRCATAPTRSPTGRSSTRWSTPPPARAGSRSTTAAASAWASRCTPAR